MADRSSRPRSMPTTTPLPAVKAIVRLPWRHRLGPVQIGGRLGLPASTVHAVLVRRVWQTDFSEFETAAEGIWRLSAVIGYATKYCLASTITPTASGADACIHAAVDECRLTGLLRDALYAAHMVRFRADLDPRGLDASDDHPTGRG